VAGTYPVTRVIGPTDDVVLHVIGSGFTRDSVINFGNYIDENTVYVSGTELTTIITGSLFTGIDPAVPIAVHNGDIYSNVIFFAFQDPAANNPRLTAVTPATVPEGSTVTLTGSGFSAINRVHLGPPSDPTALQTTFVSATELTAVIPPGTAAPVRAIFVIDPGPIATGVSQAKPITITAAGAVTATEAAPEVAYDPSAHTVDEVKAHVEAHPDELDAIYDAEQSGKARTTLLDWLAAREER
jgi:hypothetical protein